MHYKTNIDYFNICDSMLIMNKTYLVATLSILLVVIVFGRDLRFYGTKSNNQTITYSNNIKSTVAVNSINKLTGLASVILSNGRNITWSTGNFPENAGVDINLIRKVSGDPVVYELVRQISVNTTNDGNESWSPRDSDLDSNLYIEVTCSNVNPNNCSISGDPIKVN